MCCTREGWKFYCLTIVPERLCDRRPGLFWQFQGYSQTKGPLTTDFKVFSESSTRFGSAMGMQLLVTLPMKDGGGSDDANRLWLTGRCIDELVGNELSQFDQVRQEFMDILEKGGGCDDGG